MQFFLYCTKIYLVHYIFVIILRLNKIKNIFNKRNRNKLRYTDMNRANDFTKLSSLCRMVVQRGGKKQNKESKHVQ